jgi:hypothetical protein
MKTVVVHSQQRWDYCFEARRTETSLLVALNELGQQGWELVDALYYKDMKGVLTWGAFLKRPGVGPAAQPAQQTAAAVKAVPAENAPESARGFDLSGTEFPLKAEPLAAAQPEDNHPTD